MDSFSKFKNDSVIKFTPVTFAGTFVRKMRKAKGLANISSIRTTISIPRFLTARYFRKEALDPMDYYEAAVYNTPYEDQHIAKIIANDILFPKSQKKTKQKKSTTSEHNEKQQSSGLDQIMNELNDAGFDDITNLMDIDQNQDLDTILKDQLDAWDFFEQILQSDDKKDISRLELLEQLDSEYSIVRYDLTSRQLIDNYIKQELSEQAGSWSPDTFQPAIELNMEEPLLRYSQMPWETATAMALTESTEYQSFMEEMLKNSRPISLGTTLNYLSRNDKRPNQQWIDSAFDRTQNMSEYYEMVKGMKEFREPPKRIMEHASKFDIKQSLDIAEKIDSQFGTDISKRLFDEFRKNHENPTVDQVQNATYDDGTGTWENMLSDALNQHSKKQDQSGLSKLAETVANHKSSRLSTKMKRFQTNEAKEIATQSIEKIKEINKFIPEVEYLIEQGAQPYIDRTISAGMSIGVKKEKTNRLFKEPLQLLNAYIESNISNQDEYDKVVRKINKIPKNMMSEMMQKAVKNLNHNALGALGAADLGQAMKSAKGLKTSAGTYAQQTLIDSLDKSIGGGTNLLKQWFKHRKRVPKQLKDRLKNMMREALLEIGMEWANRGTGSTEEGIIPKTQTRPYQPGDELDDIDIEATLETLLMSGKKLDQITEDELMVTETSKGKTSLGVLIDISGSMSGSDLAMCAIAVVMLLGKLKSKEVAIALFESDTHVVKEFNDEKELDKVADQLLDLKARGGTRANRALKWVSRQFEEVTDSEVKILYFLSDFYLSEKEPQITNLCDTMVSEGVKILAAYHGNYQKNILQHIVEVMDGSSMKINDFDELPVIITYAIATIGH